MRSTTVNLYKYPKVSPTKAGIHSPIKLVIYTYIHCIYIYTHNISIIVILSQATVQILSSEKGISPTKQRIEAATAEHVSRGVNKAGAGVGVRLLYRDKLKNKTDVCFSM